MKPHIHAELIKAWADGAEIQYFSKGGAYWEDQKHPAWYVDAVYRIKPREVAQWRKDLAQALLEGKTVEYKNFGRWIKTENHASNFLDPLVTFDSEEYYRIKPEPKEDYVFSDHIRFCFSGNTPGWICESYSTLNPNVNLVFDGETRELKNIKMIKRPGLSQEIQKVEVADSKIYHGKVYAKITYLDDVIQSILIL